MSVITEVMKRTGASRADIVRVATRGGDTRADWAIAYAIESAGGRQAHELMFTAGRDQMITDIWGDTGAPAEAPAPTNPEAKYDPEVRIYGEDTAPDAPPTVLPDHPHEIDDEPVDEVDDQAETDPGRTVWNNLLHTHVWADVAALTSGTPDEIARTVRPWATARDAITEMTTLIARRRADRTPNTIAAALIA